MLCDIDIYLLWRFEQLILKEDLHLQCRIHIGVQEFAMLGNKVQA